MRLPGTSNLLSAVAVCVFAALFAFAGFAFQHSPPSPVPADPSPSPSASRTPAETPTPTPIPVARNFHRWGSITLFNGLPSDSIRAIAQTADGVIWFGTDNGLARFDGRRIQNFSFGEGDANHVLDLKSEPTGELWVGTQNGAYLFLDGESKPVAGTEGIGITAILTGESTLFGTNAGVIFRIRRTVDGSVGAESIIASPILAPNGNPVRFGSLLEFDGKLLAATRERGILSVRDGGVADFQTKPLAVGVNALAKSGSGKLWIGTDAAKSVSGIYSVGTGLNSKRINAPTAIVQAIETNDQGTWVGTERSGLFHIDESDEVETYTFENTSGGLRSDTIFTLFTDREGVVWIGTNRGVSRYDPQGAFQQTISSVPNSNFVRTFSRMWAPKAYVGTNRGLFVRDGRPGWTEVPGLKNKTIYALGSKTSGTMIVGTPDGVFELSGKKLFEGDVRGFASFNTRDYAAVFGRGVVDITGGAPQTVFDDTTVTCVANLDGNRFWIGTAGHGLFSFDGRTAELVAGPEELNSGAIRSLFDASDGTLFIAGEHGVFTLRDGKAEKIIAAEEVRDVFSADGHVWAATTSRGLLHARFDEHAGWLVSSLGFEQGMPSDKAFLVRPEGDRLLVATNRGIVWYKPGTVPPKIIPVRVLSRKLHDPKEFRSTIELDYPQNSLLVEVAGQSSRTFPEEFQYDFVVRNARGEIVDKRVSNDSQYAAVGLEPGDYTIESRAFDRDLLASEPLLIKLTIRNAPFPWTATALAVLLLIALIALIWAVIERRRIAHRNRELAAARFDLANEAERERNRIARDLHDQTLADLRNLMLMSDGLTPRNPKFREEIESVSTEIRRICEDLSPSVLENVGLVAALEFLVGQSAADHKFTSNDDSEDFAKFPLIVELHIYRIAQEILTNIKHHSDADLVEMDVRADENGFRLTIADNGKPFEPDDSNGNGRGIANIRSRANIINARIAWSERPEGGNLFSLAISDHGSS